MAVYIDGNQTRLVATKRLKTKPKWYNASLGKKMTISDDFEAFLILQGRSRNGEAVNWLQNVSDYSIESSDRDALVHYAIEAEKTDADQAASELEPVIKKFGKFKERFLMTGFEHVTESGQLLADLQRPMSEIITLGARHKHRQRYTSVLEIQLGNRGLTTDQSKQLNSWFEPLTTY